jgi:hypothetical protein
VDVTAHAQRRRERTSPVRGGSVHLHIDRLALHDVAPAEAVRLAEALEAELAGLAAQPGAQFVPIMAERMPAARIVAGSVPEQTGRAVASAVWSGISAGCAAGQGGR